jgi:glycosyltransferase involved in cell wall biosynthesis
VLIVSHEASRTGAPRVAVEIVEALAGLPVERVAVVRWHGPLTTDFRHSADRTRLEPLRRLRVTLRRFRTTRRLAVTLEQGVARLLLIRERPAVAYLNTVKSACYIRPALDLGIRVVLHSHEVGDLAPDTLARYQLDGLYDQVRLVACSSAAAGALMKLSGSSMVTTIHSSVDTDQIRQLARLPGSQPAERPATGLVGACGTADHRKGTDLWIRLAAILQARAGEECPQFIWIGSQQPGSYQAMARRLGLEHLVRFVEPVANPYPWLAALDVLTVTSREDAFPLVVLEAMALGVPVVAFDVGGLGEELGPAGVLVPPGDLDAMAGAVLNLLRDVTQRRELAAAANERVEKNFGITTFRGAVASLVNAELSVSYRSSARRAKSHA